MDHGVSSQPLTPPPRTSHSNDSSPLSVSLAQIAPSATPLLGARAFLSLSPTAGRLFAESGPTFAEASEASTVFCVEL